jgi:hypothetical protein
VQDGGRDVADDPVGHQRVGRCPHGERVTGDRVVEPRIVGGDVRPGPERGEPALLTGGDNEARQPTNPSTRGTSTCATSSTVAPGTASATQPTVAGSQANSSAV